MTQPITAYSIGEAWLGAIRLVLKEGTIVPDEGKLLLEVRSLIIKIIHPPEKDDIIATYGNRAHIDMLTNNFNNLSSIQEWGYSYAQRLYANNSRNQIEWVISKLLSNPFSKSATISLLQPLEDTMHIPCLTTLDFKLREGCLLLTAFFRSQDVGKKMYGDALALRSLGETMKAKLPCTSITLNLFIASAHIYEEDIDAMKAIIKAVS